MATVTPRIRPFDLGEAHRRVRHPLERLRGYIRFYVGAQALATLLTALALWFWVSLIFDFGIFKLFGVDWVQEAPLWLRATSLGFFYALVLGVTRFPAVIGLAWHELSESFREMFSASRRQLVPFWVKVVIGWLGIGVAVGIGYLGKMAGGEQIWSVFVMLLVLVAGPLAIAGIWLEYARASKGVRAALAALPPMMWVRFGLGLFGALLGAGLGYGFGASLFNGEFWSAGLMSALFASVAGGVAWWIGSMLYLLVEGGSVSFVLGLPAMAGYMVLWCLTGLWAYSDYPPATTALLVCILLVAPVIVSGFKQWFYDFRDGPLALVLERRFPSILGDRLITAVELANPREAAKLGYSRVMVEETIHEAAQRVEKLPLGEVFDWRRLVRQYVVVLLVTVGGYLIAGGVAVAADAFDDQPASVASFGRLHDVAAIWGERNVLLENTIWPRRAHLEFLPPFDGADEFKVGRDNATPTIKVRALKWLITDRTAPEGWRLMHWSDLNQDLLGEPVPSLSLPADWAIREPWLGPSIDEIELRLDKADTHKTMASDVILTLRDTLAQLEERSKLPSMSRRFRMLTIPDTVYVNYWGGNMRSEMTLKQLTDNEYEGTFPDLKESITLRARGEDYYTKTKRIVVVPPPSLLELTRDEYQPAYLYYRAKPEQLKGKKQVRRNITVSLFGGDVSRIDVPAGSDVVLHATTDKELNPSGVRVLTMEDKKPLRGAHVDVETNKDGQHKAFSTRFDNVRTEIKFVFEFVDADNVVGRRQVAIKPQEDLPPTLELQVEVLRKTPQGYLVTPLAQVPFSGVVRDDRGLEGIEFAWTLKRTDPGDLGGRPVLMLGAMHLLAGGVGHDVLTAACLSTLAREPKTEGEGQGRVEFLHFKEKVNRERLNWDDVLKRLDRDFTREDMPRPLTKDFKFDGDDADLWFDLDPTLAAQRYPNRGKLPRSLKAPEGQRQPRYRMQLWLEATDTDVVTGPHRGLTTERFNFVIVSEEELISEIAKEEEAHHVKLEAAVGRLREGENKLSQMKLDLAVMGGPKKDQFGPLSLRAEEIEQTLEKTLTTVTEVHSDYQRILSELKLNRIQTVSYVENIEKNIVSKLREALDVDFPDADKAMKELHRLLDLDDADLTKKTTDTRAAGDVAGTQMAKLIKRLDDVLASMEKLTTINKLIAVLLQIQEGLGGQEAQYQSIKNRIEDDLFKGLEAPDVKEKKPEEKKK